MRITFYTLAMWGFAWIIAMLGLMLLVDEIFIGV
tara:strand:- start:90 stop:191 length:102 start_codon:yes stop_codon:yes gene_type:complete